METPSHIPHDLQCCSGQHNPTLGESDGANGSGRGGTRRVGAGPCGIFLHIWRTSHIAPAREFAEVVWRPHRPLQPGRPPYKREKDGEYDLPDLPHTWRHDGGRLWETGDRGQAIIPGASEVTGAFTGVWCGDIHGVATGTPPNPTQHGTVGSG